MSPLTPGREDDLRCESDLESTTTRLEWNKNRQDAKRSRIRNALRNHGGMKILVQSIPNVDPEDNSRVGDDKWTFGPICHSANPQWT